MTTAELLTTIQAAGVAFEVHGGNLRCKPKPPDDLLALIREHKAEIIAELVRRSADTPNAADLTRDVPDNPELRAEIHRLLNQADELDRAGDTSGMVRILDDIERLIQKQTPSQAVVKAVRDGGVGKDEVTAATTPYNAPNAKAGDNAGNAVPVRTCAADPTVSAPSDHSELVTERAAILEYDAGMARATAEREAVAEIGPCYLCGGGRFWVSRWGVIVCERCHPPADTKLIERNISIHV